MAIFRALIVLGVLLSPLASCGGSAAEQDPCALCSATATCSAAGSCACPAGFAGDGTLAGTGCSNVNECAVGAGPCAAEATCQDSEGSFACTCADGYAGDGVIGGTACVDVDECAAAADPCGGASVCVNNAGAFQCRGIYAPSPFQNHVYRLQPTTLAVLETIDPVLETGAATGATAYAEHPVSGVVYAVVKVGAERKLVRFDAMTQTYSQELPLADKFSSIAFDAAGNLFGVTGDGATVRETLYQLDPATGEATLLRALGNGSDGEVIQFNPEDGKLYHWSGGTSNFEAITMEAPYEVTALSATFGREVFGAFWDATAHDFAVFDITSAVRRFATDGTFTTTDVATFPDDLRSPGTTEAPPHLLAPVTGDVAGGLEITLVGSGFAALGDSTTVAFGSDTAVGTVIDDHHITTTAPAVAVAETVDVTISAGAYRFAWPQAFTYTSTPTARTATSRAAAATRSTAATTSPAAPAASGQGGEPSDDAMAVGCRVTSSSGGGALLLLWGIAALTISRRRRRRR